MSYKNLALQFTVFFVLLFKFNLTFTQQISANTDRSEYLSIDSLINKYEQQNGIRIYYMPEWFENKKLHISAIALPPEDFFL
jgi:hypothetical protein